MCRATRAFRRHSQADSGTSVGRGDGRDAHRVYTTGLRSGERVRYGSMVQAFGTIARDEGLRGGLYRGAGVTVARASVLNGAQLASYDSLKHAAKRLGGWREVGARRGGGARQRRQGGRSPLSWRRRGACGTCCAAGIAGRCRWDGR